MHQYYQLIGNCHAQEISSNTRYAAVAILVNLIEEEIFLIKRSSHPNDPWSGQIGLPGGRQELCDQSLMDTAIRETFEEVSIKLKPQYCAGWLNDQQGYAAGGKINLTVRPFVFLLSKQPRAQLNYEIDKSFWLPMDYLQNELNHLRFKPLVDQVDRPAVQIEADLMLWGMTYRIIADLFKALKISTPFIGDTV